MPKKKKATNKSILKNPYALFALAAFFFIMAFIAGGAALIGGLIVGAAFLFLGIRALPKTQQKKKNAAKTQRAATASRPATRPAAATASRPAVAPAPQPARAPKPSLTEGQQEYINARKLTYDQLMQINHKEISIVCSTQSLAEWADSLTPGQTIELSPYSENPSQLEKIRQYNPHSQFYCVSVSQDDPPVARVAVNEISVYNASEETDTSFPAIPPDVPPMPDRYGNPTQGIEHMNFRLQYRPGAKGTRLINPTPGAWYPRGTQLSIRRYRNCIAVQDGPAIIGYLDFSDQQTVTHYGIANVKCYVDACENGEITVFVVKK